MVTIVAVSNVWQLLLYNFYMEIKEKFGDRLKELRIKNNLSQRELAKKLNISKTAINYWEKGLRTPTLDVVINIADYFGVTLDYLSGRD